MDEISMFAELRPAPPADADADAIRAVVRGRVTSVLSEADPAAHRRRPRARRSPASPRRSPVRRRVLIGGGLVAAATAAAIAVPAWLPGAGGTVVAKAWAVERNSDGTVTVTVSQQFNDPAGLQRALAADGITAFVAVHREITGQNAGGGYAYDDCNYLNLDYAPQAVENAVVAEGKNTVSSPPSVFDNLPTFIIHPAAMPEGSALLIAAWRSPDGTSLGTLIPTVLRTDKPPFCTPNTTPLGVVPVQLPIQQVTAPTGPGSSARANPSPERTVGLSARSDEGAKGRRNVTPRPTGSRMVGGMDFEEIGVSHGRTAPDHDLKDFDGKRCPWVRSFGSRPVGRRFLTD